MDARSSAVPTQQQLKQIQLKQQQLKQQHFQQQQQQLHHQQQLQQMQLKQQHFQQQQQLKQQHLQQQQQYQKQQYQQQQFQNSSRTPPSFASPSRSTTLPPSPHIASFSPLPAQSPLLTTPSFPQQTPHQPMSPNRTPNPPPSPILNSKPPSPMLSSFPPPVNGGLSPSSSTPQRQSSRSPIPASSSTPTRRSSTPLHRDPNTIRTPSPPSLTTSTSTSTQPRRKSTIEYSNKFNTSPRIPSPSRHSPSSLTSVSPSSRPRKSSVDYYRIAEQSSSPSRSPNRSSQKSLAPYSPHNKPRKLSYGSSTLPSPIRADTCPVTMGQPEPTPPSSPFLQQPPAFAPGTPKTGAPRKFSLSGSPPPPLHKSVETTLSPSSSKSPPFTLPSPKTTNNIALNPFSKSLPVTPPPPTTIPIPTPKSPPPITSFSRSLPSTKSPPGPSPPPKSPPCGSPLPFFPPLLASPIPKSPPPPKLPPPPQSPTPSSPPPPPLTSPTSSSPRPIQGLPSQSSSPLPPRSPVPSFKKASTSVKPTPPKPASPPARRPSPLPAKISSPPPPSPLPPTSPLPPALRGPAPLPPISPASTSSPPLLSTTHNPISFPSSPPPLSTSLSSLHTSLSPKQKDFSLPPPRPAPPTTPAPLPPPTSPTPLPPSSPPPPRPASPAPPLSRPNLSTPPGVLPPGVSPPSPLPHSFSSSRPLPPSLPPRASSPPPPIPERGRPSPPPPLPLRASSPPISSSSERPKFSQKNRRRSNSLFENSPSAPRQPPRPKGVPMLPPRTKITQRPTSCMRHTSPIESVATRESGFDLAKAGRLRTHTLNEVIQTEHAYIAHLAILSRVFMFPMKALGVLSPKELVQLFSNVGDLSSYHQSFVAQLEESTESQKKDASQTNTVAIGEIFVSFMKDLKVYSQYATNHDEATKLLEELKSRKDFASFLEVSHKDPDCQGLSLDAFLIKPVQRLCKYPLFLRDLIKYTPPTHPDYALLNEAFETVTLVVQAVNEEKREKEKEERMKTIEKFGIKGLMKEGRKLQMEGRLSVTKKGGTYEERILVLFNDLILVLKPKKEGEANEFSEVVASADLNKTILVNVGDDQGFKHRFEVLFDSKKIIFFASSMEEKTVWVNEIRQCIKKFQIENLRKLKNKDKDREIEDKVKAWGGSGMNSRTKQEKKRLNALSLSPRNTIRERGIFLGEGGAGAGAGGRTPKRPSIFAGVFSQEEGE